jgi:hypothetical protein
VPIEIGATTISATTASGTTSHMASAREPVLADSTAASRFAALFPGSLCTFGGPSLSAVAESDAAAYPGPWNFVIIQ